MDHRQLLIVEKDCIGLAVGPKTGLKNKLVLTVDQGCFDRLAKTCNNRETYTLLYASVAPLTVKLNENVQIYFEDIQNLQL